MLSPLLFHINFSKLPTFELKIFWGKKNENRNEGKKKKSTKIGGSICIVKLVFNVLIMDIYFGIVQKGKNILCGIEEVVAIRAATWSTKIDGETAIAETYFQQYHSRKL